MRVSLLMGGDDPDYAILLTAAVADAAGCDKGMTIGHRLCEPFEQVLC